MTPLSPHVAALRGIVTAARNYESGSGLTDAIQIHTAFLDRSEVLAVLALLAGVLSMTFDDLARMCEEAADRATVDFTAPPGADDGADPDRPPP
ncbi:hypothetical protein [Nocardia aurea]|uniref:hypothetical protein n=1 Tax=Nocardia aurea TaxID=2144174 RepID=UPI0033B86979